MYYGWIQFFTCADEEDVEVGRCDSADTGFAVYYACSAALHPCCTELGCKAGGAYASDKTGMDITVDRVRLEFPLDLGVHGFRMIQQNDSLPQVKTLWLTSGNLLLTYSFGRC